MTAIAESSKGKTDDFESSNLGSTPSSATKVCPHCPPERGPQPLENFGVKNKGTYQSFCLPCNREQNREWYRENKAALLPKIRKRSASYVQRNKRYVCDWLRSHPCLDCGESDIIVLEFDHIADDKSGNVSTMMFSGVSLGVLQSEIDKCEVVCANCHKRRTSLRGG